MFRMFGVADVLAALDGLAHESKLPRRVTPSIIAHYLSKDRVESDIEEDMGKLVNSDALRAVHTMMRAIRRQRNCTASIIPLSKDGSKTIASYGSGTVLRCHLEEM